MEAVKVLIATQDRKLRSELRHGLQMMGHLVAEAGDGRQVLEILIEEPPDFMLLEVMIPVVGSVSLLAELKQMHSRPHPRTTLLVEAEEVPLAMDGIRLGASDFLIKPVTTEDVQSSICSVICSNQPDEDKSSDVVEAIHASLVAGTFGSIGCQHPSDGSGSEPALLNLAGLVQEAHGRVEAALSFYQRAMAADGAYWPAQQNHQRLLELRECGETNRQVCVEQQSKSLLSPQPVSAAIQYANHM